MDARGTTFLSIDEREIYLRQMMLPEFGVAGQMALKRSRVLVVGAGGLGSPTSLYLAAAGIGHLTIIDHDVVDRSNLHRQVLFTPADQGQPKADVAARRLRAQNPEITVEPIRQPFDIDNALELVGRSDLVVDCTDNFATRYLVNDACVRHGVPYVYASVFRHEALLSVFATRNGPCYRCVYPQPPPSALAPSCAEGGVLGVLPGVLGVLQATEAIKLLAGIGEPAVGRLIQYDALAMRFQQFDVSRDPDCAACATRGVTTVGPLAMIGGECASGEPPVRTTTTRALALRRSTGEELTLIDVRSADEHALEAIDGSICLPVDELSARLHEIPADHPIICYCLSGVRSTRAAAILVAAGFANVESLQGGILMWDPAADRRNAA